MSIYREGESYNLAKKPHIKVRFNKKNMEELLNCIDDPLYFMENFMYIQHPIRGRLLLDPYDYQREMIDVVHNNRFSILLTARQLGKTTIAAGYLLWYAMFIPDSTILIVANKGEQAREIMQRIRYAYEEIPNHIRAGSVTYNKGSIEFDNGSRIVSRATSSTAARGLSVTLLYCDEFAFVHHNMAKEFWTSIQPTLSTGGGCIITSTPNGDEDIFAQIWRGAIDNIGPDGFELPNGRGKNGFKAFKALWDLHPDRDEEWADEQRSQLGTERFDREFGCEFITAEETLIDSTVLRRLTGAQPVFKMGTIRWYEKIHQNRIYLVSLDPATGTSGPDGDRAAIQIYELPDMRQVGEWCCNKTAAKGQTKVLLDILCYIHGELSSFSEQTMNPDNSIYWTFENNGVGEAIGAVITESGLDNFPGYFIREPKRRGRGRNKMGLFTSAKPKMTACIKLKSLLETDRLTIKSKALISEIKHYIKKGSGFEAKAGLKDDLVSATLLTVRLLDIVKDYDPEMTKKLREVIDIEGEAIIPMPFVMLSSF